MHAYRYRHTYRLAGTQHVQLVVCARALDGGGWDGCVAEVQARRHDILSSIVLTVPGRMRIVCGSRKIAWLEPKGNTYL